MAIRITAISPKPDKSLDSVASHLSIEKFQWINEVDQKIGVSTRDLMFDWIVNKKGRAYIKKGDDVIFVFGANALVGKYLRAVNDSNWTDDLLDLPEIS